MKLAAKLLSGLIAMPLVIGIPVAARASGSGLPYTKCGVVRKAGDAPAAYPRVYALRLSVATGHPLLVANECSTAFKLYRACRENKTTTVECFGRRATLGSYRCRHGRPLGFRCYQSGEGRFGDQAPGLPKITQHETSWILCERQLARGCCGARRLLVIIAETHAGERSPQRPFAPRGVLELGVTRFDTAEIYGFGRSERILGYRRAAASLDSTSWC